MVRIQSLHRYPLKSARGETLESVEVGPRGMLYDREWMIVDENGLFLTQRTVPTLCRLRAFIHQDYLYVYGDNRLGFFLPIHDRTGRLRQVQVWDDVFMAVDQGDGPSAWVSEVIGQRCRVVRVAPSEHVRTSQRIGGSRVGFADTHSFTVVSQASFDDLNHRMPSEMLDLLPRFRPNIVVNGCEAYAEDAWPALRLGEIQLVGHTVSTRCDTIMTDQTSGVRGKEPMTTLAKYRRTPPDVRPRKVLFARNFSHRGTGLLKVGDEMVIES